MIKGEKEGYENYEIKVEVKAGETGEITLTLIEKIKRFNVNGVSFNMVYIPPGSFMMGSETGDNDERPVHKVTLTKGYYLGETEVTLGQFEAFVKETGYETEAEKGDGCYIYDNSWKKKKDVNWKNPYMEQDKENPVVCVSWNDAQQYIEWLKNKTGESFRLPTEAEWEYAARAETTKPFAFGECLSTDDANYDGNYPLEGCPKGIYRGKTVPVKSFRPNAWGLYDMHGNVLEWCSDVYVSDAYSKHSPENPEITTGGSRRVGRGGGWFDGAGARAFRASRQAQPR